MEPQSRNTNYQDRQERQKWAQFDHGNAPVPAEQVRIVHFIPDLDYINICFTNFSYFSFKDVTRDRLN